jgi:hypothetical protein
MPKRTLISISFLGLLAASAFKFLQPQDDIPLPSLDECIEGIIARTEGEASGKTRSEADRELSFQCAMRSSPVLANGNLNEDQRIRLAAARALADNYRQTKLVERFPDAEISRLLRGGDTIDSPSVFDATRKALSEMGCSRSHFINEAGWTRSINHAGAGERFFIWCGAENRIYWDTIQNVVFRE